MIGALAALRYRGDPRLTRDLDLLVEPVDELEASLRTAGFDVTALADPGEPPHLLVLRRDEMTIDVLVSTTEYQAAALDRAVDHVITAEDVIVHKLIAWRPRDRDDVLSILRGPATVDEAYVDHWADQWQVTDRWEQARRSR